jgi:cell volume regulation protein A
LIFQPLSPFNARESLLISWCGLRGAVPLALSYRAVDQLSQLRGVAAESITALAQNGQGIVFVVVLANLLVQGLSMPRLCRQLKLEAAPVG